MFLGTAKVFGWNGTTWLQKGQTINGESNYDQAGIDVAISADGNTIGVGSVECCNVNSKEGVVKVYEYNGSTWIQKGSEMRGVDVGDHFGSRISMNDAGTRIAVADLTVSAKAYDWNGNDWYMSGGWINAGGGSDASLEFDVCLSGTGKELAFGDVTTMNILDYHGTTRVYQLDGEVSLNENKINSVYQLFPNPTNSIITILGNKPYFSVELISPTGELLEEYGFHKTYLETIAIDRPSGVYFIRIQDNEQSQLFRVVKM